MWVNAEETKAIATFLNQPEFEVKSMYSYLVGKRRSLREKANGDCVFYDAQVGCTIYPVRPRQCQTWPFWQGNVKTPEDWQETCEICPGSGQGKLFSAEEISQRLKEIKP